MNETNKNIRLSVIIPTYNCRAYIEETLRSILEEMDGDCELIVVDDGSDDGTIETLKSYRGEPRVKIMLRSHEGASGARNAGIEVASGEYLTFWDCDDTIKTGFFQNAKDLMGQPADMIIFGFERRFLDGRSEISAVKDHFYPDVSSFADEYIRSRAMLIYSVCNKLYRKAIIDSHHIRCQKGMMFGEDRLFNYSFLQRAGTIRTSELILYNYVQRSLHSMSAKHYPGFFRLLCSLHEEKMKCFLTLSKGTDREEREDFINYDMKRAVIAAIERFDDHPEEIAENLPAVAKMIYGDNFGKDEEHRLKEGNMPEEKKWYNRPCDNAAIKNLI